MKQPNQQIHFNQYLAWSIAALLYSLSFFIKVSPNTLQTVLQQDLGISFHQLGTLSAAFYYSYGTFQIVGTLLSLRFGLVNIFWAYLLIFSCGLAIFINANTYELAFLGRFLMGIGSSLDFAFCLFLARSFFPKKRFAAFIGLSNLFGVIGGWLAQYPLEIFIAYTTWRTIFSVALACLPIFAAGLALTLQSTSVLVQKRVNIKKAFLELSERKYVLFLMLYLCFSMVLPILMIPEMWGSLFLETIYSISSLQASVILSYFFIGIGVGNIFLGFVTKKYSHTTTIKIALGCELLFCLLFIYGNHIIPVKILPIIAAIIGMSASSLLVFFDILNETFHDPRLAFPTLNIFMTLLSASSHPLIGWYIDSQIASGISINEALLQSFSLAPFFLTLSLLIVLFYPQVTQKPATLS